MISKNAITAESPAVTEIIIRLLNEAQGSMAAVAPRLPLKTT
jgi:hypothetical protein